MAIGNFKKNVVENLWEATYSVGKAKEIFYIRTESEYLAKSIADEHATEINGNLIDLILISPAEEEQQTVDSE